MIDEVALLRERFLAFVTYKDRVESVCLFIDLLSYVIEAPFFFLQDWLGLDYRNLLEHVLVLSSLFDDSLALRDHLPVFRIDTSRLGDGFTVRHGLG